MVEQDFAASHLHLFETLCIIRPAVVFTNMPPIAAGSNLTATISGLCLSIRCHMSVIQNKLPENDIFPMLKMVMRIEKFLSKNTFNGISGVLQTLCHQTKPPFKTTPSTYNTIT